MDKIKIVNGRIFIYRAFDVGYEINLHGAYDILKNSTSALRFKLKKETRAMVINNAPLAVSLGIVPKELLNQNFEIEISAKIWHFGVISVVLAIKIPPNLQWADLIALSALLENDPSIHQIAYEKSRELVGQIGSVIKNAGEVDVYEDYIIYFLENIEGIEKNTLEIFDKVDVHALILTEQKEKLSEQTKKTITDSTFQYSVNDLAVIDWNSALVIEPTGSQDVPDVIEFAICQLLEMRYYDDVLDEKLSELYSLVDQKKYGLLDDIYSNLSKAAGRKYLDISEVIENVENSMKVVGDFYYSTIFRATVSRFRINDWKMSVDNKLSNLAEFSKLLHDQVSEKRSTLLEITIIVLIAIELIPLFKEMFLK